MVERAGVAHGDVRDDAIDEPSSGVGHAACSARRTGLAISVCHLPPGISKWNKIEHRMFSFITQNWRGRPLLTHATIVSLIAGTKTTTGLKIRCELDR